MTHANVFTSPQPASDWLKQGNLLAYPTESVWGIGCDAYDEQAVHAILAIKNRPIDKGMIVVTDSIERIDALLKPLPSKQRQTILVSWKPSDTCQLLQAHQTQQARQANTWLLPITTDTMNSEPIPTWITGKHNSVAVRVINHPLIKTLCANMVSPSNPYGFIVSTSCNPAGDTPAKTLTEAMAYFACHSQVGFLQDETLGYELPSQIRDGATGSVIR